ncbi:flagellar brake protein [Paenibacillus alvei]|uniref:Glycosyl transferase n=2 Tax=Paenibacillus alvei TaxID=44250 RepID=A0AAP6ZR00_PAEAL|nr:PilZ domain-containing protein [Paenibacillus alvei]MBG9736067.1 glycosyl transferase [Paenibacillus alvei]MBG9743368.1 glycosyl transferase [Paenibacillus alvei]MCY9579359.1 PilZ domain-containing protein [Paenibacillus alvei]MCY9586009.1 PilZ domain-containing protein [Paenibacillus alvei]NEZ42949.1 glycosyl transferase [Paenibacillus alvei]
MLPNVNDTLYVQLIREKTEGLTYKARVTEVNEQLLWMEIPLSEETGKYGLFSNGDELDIYFSQSDGTKWNFRSQVMGRRQDTIPMMSIRKPEPHWLTQMQRRNYLRIQAFLEMAIRTTDGVKFLALTEDISGGGLSFTTDFKWGLRESQVLQCWIAVPFRNGSIEHVPFTGHIVRVQPMEEHRQLVMLKFEQIANVEQQRLIRYCFERQLDLRK